MSADPPSEEMKVAVRYEPPPYWGCPYCGGNSWGAINPTSDDEYIYRCHGHAMGEMMYTGCGRLFKLPPEAHEEGKATLLQEGFDITEANGETDDS